METIDQDAAIAALILTLLIGMLLFPLINLEDE